jgi:hypothetical protein
MEKPTLKAIHIGKLHQPTHKPKLAKEYVFANANRRTKKKYDCPTMVTVAQPSISKNNLQKHKN